MKSRKQLELQCEKFFLKRIHDQFSYMPLNEALDFNDRREIQKMIRNDIGSKTFRQELNKVFRQDFEDALRAAFGINTRGRLTNYVVDQLTTELESGATRQTIIEICKEVIAKLYKEIALRYPFIINNLKVF